MRTEDSIRQLVGGNGGYAGAGAPAGHRPWYMHPQTAFNLTPEEMAELQSVGVDTSGMGIIPVYDINEYRTMKAIGGDAFKAWKEKKQGAIRNRLGPLGNERAFSRGVRSSGGLGFR